MLRRILSLHCQILENRIRVTSEKFHALPQLRTASAQLQERDGYIYFILSSGGNKSLAQWSPEEESLIEAKLPNTADMTNDFTFALTSNYVLLLPEKGKLRVFRSDLLATRTQKNSLRKTLYLATICFEASRINPQPWS